MHTSKVSVIPC